MIGGINMVVAFTGYRPEKMPFVESKKDEAYLKFRKRQLQVIERLIERGCTHFISGVAIQMSASFPKIYPCLLS